MIERELVKKILEAATSFEWTLQGFGMFRLYLGRIGRVHLWDRRFAVPGVSTIHSHPWDLTSKIIAGKLVNVRYVEAEGEANYYRQRIVTGEGGGPKGFPKAIRLEAQAPEHYFPGETYSQSHREIHVSVPDDGTVTIMQRPLGPPGETAQVCWPLRENWVSAEPRKATEKEVGTAARYALRRWLND